MKNVIKKFLKQEHYNKGQIYKVCPSKLLEEFVKFSEVHEKTTIKTKSTEISDYRKEKDDFIIEQFNN